MYICTPCGQFSTISKLPSLQVFCICLVLALFSGLCHCALRRGSAFVICKETTVQIRKLKISHWHSLAAVSTARRRCFKKILFETVYWEYTPAVNLCSLNFHSLSVELVSRYQPDSNRFICIKTHKLTPLYGRH